jgi:glycerol kinase
VQYASVDIGTSGVKLALYDEQFRMRHFETISVPLSSDGTHDAQELLNAVRHLILKAKQKGAKSLGIATYRASMVAWDKEGRPLSRVLTWLNSQEEYHKLPLHVKLLGKVGPLSLVISASSPALRYLTLERKVKEHKKEAMIWTLECFIVYALTRRYCSDATNATMTGFVHPKNFRTISAVTSMLRVKPNIPEIVNNTEHIADYEGIEINALCADQQAACVAEGAIEQGTVKITNGSGTFVDIPFKDYRRPNGLIPIVILRHKKSVVRGLEGYIPASGLTAEFLRRLGVISDYSELEVTPEGDVLFVPALAGLQLPSKPNARGIISNIALSTEKREVISGFLKSIAFFVKMVIESAKVRPRMVRANGKLSKCDTLLKMISSCLGVQVERQLDVEGTLRGVALLLALSQERINLSELEKTREAVEVITGDGVKLEKEEYLKWVSLVKSLKS